MCLHDRTLSSDDVEMHLATTHLAHFLLTNLISVFLKASPSGGRVVNVWSSAHAISPLHFSDTDFLAEGDIAAEDQPEREACEHFDIPWALGYDAQSRTAVILHALALAQTFMGSGLTALSVNLGGMVFLLVSLRRRDC